MEVTLPLPLPLPSSLCLSLTRKPHVTPSFSLSLLFLFFLLPHLQVAVCKLQCFSLISRESLTTMNKDSLCLQISAVKYAQNSHIFSLSAHLHFGPYPICMQIKVNEYLFIYYNYYFYHKLYSYQFVIIKFIKIIRYSRYNNDFILKFLTKHHPFNYEFMIMKLTITELNT